MTDTIFLCTVGGSPEPIVKAIQDTQDMGNLSFVCFFCSRIDDATGRKGSRTEIEGKDGVPAKTDLSNEQFGICEVSPDNLDDCFTNINDEIISLKQRYPSGRFVANYTGGTKTMSAALVCATLEHDDVHLTLTTGPRGNLERVQSGTESSVNVNIKEIRTRRRVSECLASWQYFNYHEAEEGLRIVGREISTDSRYHPRILLFREVSRAFRLVDNFDYSGALDILNQNSKFVSKHYPNMLPSIGPCSQENNPLSEPMKLFHLWHSAERRAIQGRFDDAVGRWYRMIEGAAQWQLKSRLDADTSDFREDLLPRGEVESNRGSDGKVRIGLRQAWMVIKDRLDGPAGDFIAKEENTLYDLLSVRNQSILAHGFTPVDEENWLRIRSWTEEKFLPTLKELVVDAVLKNLPTQLPTEPPESWDV